MYSCSNNPLAVASTQEIETKCSGRNEQFLFLPPSCTIPCREDHVDGVRPLPMKAVSPQGQQVRIPWLALDARLSAQTLPCVRQIQASGAEQHGGNGGAVQARARRRVQRSVIHLCGEAHSEAEENGGGKEPRTRNDYGWEGRTGFPASD